MLHNQVKKGVPGIHGRHAARELLIPQICVVSANNYVENVMKDMVNNALNKNIF